MYYTPGSYLLCHDDVIGSRRVSYILYLTDPDRPWRKEWGGGLRLYPTEKRRNLKGDDVRVPLAEHTVNIPPSFGQLSFFAVRPGESYHDVEEVYHRKAGEEEDDGGRIRMAISGWYHIPQEGEDGFEEGVEQALAQNSSLAQLKGSANEFDEPQAMFKPFDKPRNSDDERDADILTEEELTFLLKYISPSFLTPDMIEKTSSSFLEDSFLQLEKFFREPLAQELKQYITKSEANDNHDSSWPIAHPPHKHRYAYYSSAPSIHNHSDHSPIARVLADLLPSHAFQKWLCLVTDLKPSALKQQNVLARRFRRGKDYALASPYTGEQPQLEYTIGITPSSGWDREETTDTNGDTNGASATTNGHASPSSKPDLQVSVSTQPEFGGEEIYMAGDDDDAASTKSKTLPQVGKKADPAIYKSAADDDDGILFTNTPAWNVFSVVLRDKGTLRFVKYVSEAVKGDRWDIKGEVQLAEDAFEDEEGRDSDEQRSDEDCDPNHYFEDYELARAMEEHSTTEEEDEGEEDGRWRCAAGPVASAASSSNLLALTYPSLQSI